MRAHNDDKLHKHGTSTITHGRGSVLTIDLTNRCNMMCDPCFMDANQVGFVHELTWEEIKKMLDNAISIKPRRQMSVQFSGGEPTLSPYFLDAVRYAREVGYNSVQAATNGIEFAKSPEFSRQAAEAGLRYAYLQFDGIGNAANSHRQVGNLFDVKLRAIRNLHDAGVEIVPVTTIVNGINNEQVGRIIQFALDNPKKIPFCSFQPVSFTGRDEAITDERRMAQRYTLSHLAHDVKNQTGLGEPVRDWFPISFMSNYDPFKSPRYFKITDLLQKFDKCFGATKRNYGKVTADRTRADIERRRADRWNFLFIAGMWFQDLFNYDFRRTEQCIIPYGTQEGEISFCAYNTGIGWRNIIEQMHQNATVAQWYKEHGRHEIFAKGKEVSLNYDAPASLVLNEVDLQRPNKPQMEGPKTAHEEAAMMRKLYQEMVLKQKLGADVEKNTPVQIKGLSRSKKEETTNA